jgi:protocatechuate 3,4-dioxygenase beta subunit
MRNPRRTFLKVIGGSIGAVVTVAAGGFTWLTVKSKEKPLNYELPRIEPVANTLPPTASCGDESATLAQTQGPFYTPDTPKKANFREPGMKGQPLLLEGQVLTADCQPVAGAVMDVWSCDADGVYDNDGYTLRGHVFTDTDGRYRIETIRPSYYEGFGFLRAAHIHVKLQGRNTRLLTTQLYFPGEPTNSEDSIFDASLLIATDDQDDGSLYGRFDFVLERVV